LVLGQTMIAEAADRFQVDGSTIARMRTIEALAGSGVTHEQKQGGRRDQPGRSWPTSASSLTRNWPTCCSHSTPRCTKTCLNGRSGSGRVSHHRRASHEPGALTRASASLGQAHDKPDRGATVRAAADHRAAGGRVEGAWDGGVRPSTAHADPRARGGRPWVRVGAWRPRRGLHRAAVVPRGRQDQGVLGGAGGPSRPRPGGWGRHGGACRGQPVGH
jgi:hypothetical protein